jgi:hypothetical protein
MGSRQLIGVDRAGKHEEPGPLETALARSGLLAEESIP